MIEYSYSQRDELIHSFIQKAAVFVFIEFFMDFWGNIFVRNSQVFTGYSLLFQQFFEGYYGYI